MSTFLDTAEFFLFYLILVVLLTGLNVVFFISQKREQPANKLKLLIIILFGISIPLFILDSTSYLNLASESLKSSEKVLLSNIFLILLCFSVGLFFHSIYSSDDDVIDLEKPSYFKSRKGAIKMGRVMERSHKKNTFYLSLTDLEKHVFVCGATGTGKSNFIQHFLINFTKHYDIPFLLVEFKGEYHFLQREIDNLIIIRPGENFSINIFNPEGSLPEVHAERIFDILKSGKFLDDNAEFSPQMEKVLVDILIKVCGNKELQSWKGFYEYCKKYANDYKNEIPMLSQTLISITNRIRRFSLGSLKAIFDTEHELKVKDLFKRNILVDLSSIIRLGGEKEDALFFLNMVLKYLWDKNLTRGAYNFSGIKHITIVEDTQYFAPKDLTRQNKLTTYLEDIALLQRGTGECLISIATRPDISEEILANCGVLVCFKTHMQKEFLSKLLNLNEENEYYLSIVEDGQCIVRVNSIKRPFLLSVPFIDREWLETSEINRNNKKVLENFENFSESNLKGKNKKYLQKFQSLTEKCASFMNKIKLKLVNFMKIFRKKYKNKEWNFGSNSILNENIINNEDNSEKDEIRSSSHNNDDDFNKLKKFIKELYEKQQNSK